MAKGTAKPLVELVIGRTFDDTAIVTENRQGRCNPFLDAVQNKLQSLLADAKKQAVGCGVVLEVDGLQPQHLTSLRDRFEKHDETKVVGFEIIKGKVGAANVIIAKRTMSEEQLRVKRLEQKSKDGKTELLASPTAYVAPVETGTPTGTPAASTTPATTGKGNRSK